MASETRESARPSKRSASVKHGEVYRISATATRACMAELGISVRDAAKFMRCSTDSVQRYRKQGFDIPLMRSARLRRCFVEKLVEAVNGRA